ncbi:MAG: GNAT family N-acetyltransferase [Sulfurospirillaceae bacterium]|jgi:GNAT superfamily N-acetyltransferase|nr:GNAT family N-acetyltransferase [Sulfurospirillaceae bacterium]MDD2826899.1 GNAT family N-acetyltransferase [Sulfurospirillaceae bacterium]
MVKSKRTSNANNDFQALTHLLDSELKARYGNLQDIYDQHNVITLIETALVGFNDGEPIACGCFKAIDNMTVEIKRMFVLPAYRRRGFSSQILHDLEQWAYTLGYQYARLETGQSQPEAIALYQKQGYSIIDNFEPYIGMSNSVCMQKELRNV